MPLHNHLKLALIRLSTAHNATRCIQRNTLHTTQHMQTHHAAVSANTRLHANACVLGSLPVRARARTIFAAEVSGGSHRRPSPLRECSQRVRNPAARSLETHAAEGPMAQCCTAECGQASAEGPTRQCLLSSRRTVLRSTESLKPISSHSHSVCQHSLWNRAELSTRSALCAQGPLQYATVCEGLHSASNHPTAAQCSCASHPRVYRTWACLDSNADRPTGTNARRFSLVHSAIPYSPGGIAIAYRSTGAAQCNTLRKGQR